MHSVRSPCEITMCDHNVCDRDRVSMAKIALTFAGVQVLDSRIPLDGRSSDCFHCSKSAVGCKCLEYVAIH